MSRNCFMDCHAVLHCDQFSAQKALKSNDAHRGHATRNKRKVSAPCDVQMASLNLYNILLAQMRKPVCGLSSAFCHFCFTPAEYGDTWD